MQDEKVALVTGANRGMGLETCRALAELDFRVLLGSRDLAAGVEAAESLASDRVHAVALDITNAEDIATVARRIDADYGRLDVLINNAGIMIDNDAGRSASIVDSEPDVLLYTLNVNTIGPMMLINALLPLMERVDDARIVNISSGMGQLADMGGRHPGYRISKTALNAATRIYAAELDPKRVRVNAVCPGWVRTDMGGENADLSLAEGIDTAIWLATSPDATHSGGYFRRREPIDW